MKPFGTNLLVLLVLCAVPFAANAQFAFTTNNSTITITGYTGTDANVVIPSATNGYPVTAIGTNAIFADIAMTGVTVPDSVSSIGIHAFSCCPGLTNIAVNPANPSYTSAGGVLFNKALTMLILCPQGLTGSYAISNSVIVIGDFAFDGCFGLTNVTIDTGVNNIGNNAFLGCSKLTSVTIPNSVTSIGFDAFDSCSGLTNIAVDAANSSYASADGVLFNKALTTLILCPQGLTGSYAIPNSVTSVGEDAFGGCAKLTSVNIPNGVTSIGNYAFDKCYSLTSMMIPNSVTSIGDGAFFLCFGLTNVTIGNSVTNVGRYAFFSCMHLHQAFFQGNAPSVNGGSGSTDNTVFYGETGTVYYVPGTTGWTNWFGGWPTAVWHQSRPQILGPGLEAQGNRYQFTISWATNTSVVVEASTNLQNWTPVITNTLVNGTNFFQDPTWTDYPKRFYRVRSP